jgi:hypothetical protein
VLGFDVAEERHKIEKNLLEMIKGDKKDEKLLERKKKTVRTLIGSKKPNV